MNKKRLLKSMIGTVAIYGVLVAVIFFSGYILQLDVLVDYYFYLGVLIVCSIVAGLLFKGEMYAAVWSAASVIFCAVISGFDLLGIMLVSWYVLAPLLIPFFIAKALSWSWNNTN
ncbi:MAG: hypothetical protein K2J77_09355 [Oscillospiraceae bacterium]|nr:hypothetical protein [Oscillospiraceae bacterium]